MSEGKDRIARIAESFIRIHKRAAGGNGIEADVPEIRVGSATCGKAAGSEETFEAFKDAIDKKGLEVRLLGVGCLGHCYAEPMVIIRNPGFPPMLYGYVSPGVAGRLVTDYLGGGDPCLEFALGALEENEMIPTVGELPRFQMEEKIILRNVGWINPESMEEYLLEGGYEGLSRSLQMEPEDIVELVKESGLRGLGGAGFPTGRKWEQCRTAPGETKYVIGNGDEGDPGAFMDRSLIESDPFSVLEGMTVAAYAIGSHQGFLYIRSEYPLAVVRARTAIRILEEWGLLGSDILGSGFGFTVEVVEGAGAFVCGESTALQASIEGRRGMPRVRPPHSVISGLWGKPTLLNNVKTLAAVPRVVLKGSEWLRSFGTEGSKGTVVFALAGKVMNTGLVEVPMGTSLEEIIFTAGGGVPGKKAFKAVQIGGPSGGCLPAQQVKTPVDFDSLIEAGAMMGSGGMVILDEDDCMVRTARFFLEFTEKESCGKCTPCRIGTYQMRRILDRFVKGEGRKEELQLLEDLAGEIGQAALCGLGRTAPNPVRSTLRYFRDEYKAHTRGCCPAKACPDLTAYYILPDRCSRACDVCVGTCPVEAIWTNRQGIKVIDQEKCVKCGSCLTDCPPEFQAVIKVSPPSELSRYEPESSPESIPPEGK